MSKGLEMMVSSLLKGAGVNVDEIKAEALSRIENFEGSVATLNSRLHAIETNLKAICEFHGITYTPPAEVLSPKKEGV